MVGNGVSHQTCATRHLEFVGYLHERIVGNQGPSYYSVAMNTLSAIKADTHRHCGKFSWFSAFQSAVLSRTFAVVVTIRLCQAAASSPGLIRLILPLLRVAHRITTQRAAMDFPWPTKVGPGLMLTHGWGLVVNEGAQIGKNVTLYHGVTLGQRDRISRDGIRSTEFPVLEDEVWVGPHALIVGGVIVGRGSRIAGGAVVRDNVPPYSVVMGNPGAIVKSNCMPDVMNRAAV